MVTATAMTIKVIAKTTITMTLVMKETEEKRTAQSIAAHKTDSSKMATLKNQP